MPLILLALSCIAAVPGHHSRARTQLAAFVSSNSVSALVNGSSLSYDGDNDHVTIGKPADMDFNSASGTYTLAIWFKRGEAADFERHFFGKALMSTVDVTATLGVNATEDIQALVGGGENTTGGDIGASVYGWHMSSLSVTGGNASLYLDGRQVGVTFAVGADVNAASDWLIGSSRWDDNVGTGYPWKGKLDEPTVWNVAFSAAEHLELFHNGDPMNPAFHSRAAGLIHWWRMGDGDVYPTFFDQVGVADGTAVNMVGAGNITNDVPVGLDPLPCDASTSCVTHLVADDWDGSAATWTTRVGSDNATKRGTPTRVFTPNFAGRYSTLISAAGACWTIPNDNYAVGDKRTYEIIVDDWGTATGKYLASRHEGSFAQLVNLLYKNSEVAFASTVYVSGAGSVYIGTESQAYTNTAGKPIAWTITFDLAVPRWTVYRNGTQIYQDTTTAGSLTTTAAQALGLGCRWNQSAVSVEIFGGRVLEFLRHNAEMSGALVASRLTQFNALKGY